MAKEGPELGGRLWTGTSMGRPYNGAGKPPPRSRHSGFQSCVCHRVPLAELMMLSGSHHLSSGQKVLEGPLGLVSGDAGWAKPSPSQASVLSSEQQASQLNAPESLMLVIRHYYH